MIKKDDKSQWITALFAVVLVSMVVAAPKDMMTRRFVAYRSLGRLHTTSGAAVVDKFEGVANDAARHGYNGFILQYGDFLNVEKYRNDFEFKKNWGRVKAIAKSLELDLVPWTMGQLDESWEDTTLSEAFPVKGTTFRVANGIAKAFATSPIPLKNGGFENATSVGLPASWSSSASPQTARIVKTGARAGSACLYSQNPHKNVLFDQCVALKPYRAYEISLWIKTKGFTNSRKMALHVFSQKNAPLLYRRDVCFRLPDNWYGVGQTMAWRRFNADFNTLKNSWVKIRLNLTPIAASEGEVWIDGLTIREVGLYETVRNAHTPITVKSATGTIYEEGTDYTVDYRRRRSVDHDYEGSLHIPTGSRIQNGEVLTVDWFQLADVETMVPSTNYCLDKSWQIKADNIRQIDGLLKTGNHDSGSVRAWCAFYDEWRVANWDQTGGFKTSGEYMSWVLGKTDKALKQVNHNREVWVPNDMFDPYHNAAYRDDRMGWQRGGSYGSWEGMHDSTVVINWLSPSYGGRARSARFFAGVDPKHPDVCYRQVVSTDQPHICRVWADTMTKIENEGGCGFVGYAYFSWTEDFSQIGACAQAFKQAGRWGEGSVPWPSFTTPQIASKRAGSQRFATRFAQTPSAINVRYGLPRISKVMVSMVDPLGRTVLRMVREEQEAGLHEFETTTHEMPAGVYFLRLSADNDQVHTNAATHRFVIY